MVTSETFLLPGFESIFRAQDRDISKSEAEKLYNERIQKSKDEFGGPDHVNDESCRALWNAVVARALKDAIGLDMLLCNIDEEDDEPQEKQRLAIEWFLGNSDDFKVVCDHAALDSDRVRTRMISELHKRKLIYSDGYDGWIVDRDNLIKADNEMPVALALAA